MTLIKNNLCCKAMKEAETETEKKEILVREAERVHKETKEIHSLQTSPTLAST
jgi:hypothetical protein